MKKIFFSLLILGVTTSLFAKKTAIDFFSGSLDDAYKSAQKTEKLIFVEVYASWCAPCKVMEKEVFTNKTVGKFYNKNFINLKLDVDAEEGALFKMKHQIEAIPFFAFMDEQGNIVHNDIGVIDSHEFIELGELAMQYQIDMDLSLKEINTLAPQIASQLCESFKPLIDLNDKIELAKKEGDEATQKKYLKKIDSFIKKFETFWESFEKDNRGRMKNQAFSNAIKAEVKKECGRVYQVMYGSE